jgi:hypothetical protein
VVARWAQADDLQCWDRHCSPLSLASYVSLVLQAGYRGCCHGQFASWKHSVIRGCCQMRAWVIRVLQSTFCTGHMQRQLHHIAAGPCALTFVLQAQPGMGQNLLVNGRCGGVHRRCNITVSLLK